MTDSRLQGFANWLATRGRSAATARAYVDEVRRSQAVGTADYLAADGLSPATGRRRFQALRAWAEYDGTPLQALRPKLPQRVRRGNEPLELKPGGEEPPVGRHGATWRRDRACTMLCLAAGLSIGQVAGLTLGDVTVRDGRAWLSLNHREIPLASPVRRSLLDYLILRGEPLDPDSPLFLSRKGLPLPYRTLQSGVTRFLMSGGTAKGAANGRAARRAFLSTLLNERGGLAIAVDLVGLSSSAVARYAPPRRGGAAVLDKVAARLTVKGGGKGIGL